VWLTRLRAELPREALETDLVLAAASSQTEVSSYIQTTKFVGEPPACRPPPPGCEESSGSGSDGIGSDGGVSASGGKGCSIGSSGFGDAAFGGALALLGFAFYRRRRAS